MKVLLINNDPQGTLASALCCTLGEQKNTPAKGLPLQIDSPTFENGKSLCF